MTGETKPAEATVEGRLRALGIELPALTPPVVAGYVPAFVPFVRTANQIHVSGRLGVFGERGRHARSAISVAQCPFGSCVELDLLAELDG